TRHARACRGHPRLASLEAVKTWMAGNISAFTRVFPALCPAMTWRVCQSLRGSALLRSCAHPIRVARRARIDAIEAARALAAALAPAGGAAEGEAAVGGFGNRRPAVVAGTGVALGAQLAGADHVVVDDIAGIVRDRRADLLGNGVGKRKPDAGELG